MEGTQMYAEDVEVSAAVSWPSAATASVFECGLVGGTHPGHSVLIQNFPHCCDVLETSDVDQNKFAIGSAVQKESQSASGSSSLDLDFHTFDYWDPDQMDLLHPDQDMRHMNVVELEEFETLPSLDLEIPRGQRGLVGGQKPEVGIHEEVLTMKKTAQRTEAERLKYLDKQRLNHIRVERNRRKKMNKNIALLKDMLPSYQRIKNDQASIIGGVVEFISELQRLLKTLQAEKLRKEYSEILCSKSPSVLCPPVSSSLASSSPTHGDVPSASRSPFQHADWDPSLTRDTSDTYQVNTAWANVVVTKSQTFMDVLIETRWRPRQLIQIILVVQSLYLNVVQMTIDHEEENYKKTLRLVIKTELGLHCRSSVKELATAVHQSVAYTHLTSSTQTCH